MEGGDNKRERLERWGWNSYRWLVVHACGVPSGTSVTPSLLKIRSAVWTNWGTDALSSCARVSSLYLGGSEFECFVVLTEAFRSFCRCKEILRQRSFTFRWIIHSPCVLLTSGRHGCCIITPWLDHWLPNLSIGEECGPPLTEMAATLFRL